MLNKTRLKRLAVNLGLATISLAVTIAACEALLRWRYAEPARQPLPEVLAIQPYLELHPEIGFTWRPNVDAAEKIVFTIKDAEPEPLSTDANGFINPPAALRQRARGEEVHIVGLGDSFMEHAAHTFHEAFAAEDLAYYNLAIHRQSTPQYNTILVRHALPMDPDVVLYGLFENDFNEAEDYEIWQASGLDWFEFHSGTWCGRPLDPSASARLLRGTFPGAVAFARVMRSRVRGDRMSVLGPSGRQIESVTRDILDAHARTTQHGARFLLVLIPSRPTAAEGDTPEAEAYDEVLARIERESVPILDLRQAFQAHDDPASLYYAIDGHWNRNGMALAADLILQRVQQPN